LADERFAAARDAFLDGVRHLEAGRDADAARCLEASLALLPGRVSTLVNLGIARRRLGQLARALEVLDAAVLAAPDDADAWFHHGHALAESGRPDAAIDSLVRATTLAPDRRAARFDATVLLARAARTAEAQALLAPLLEAEPADAAAWSLHGRLLRDEGRDEAAAAAFQRAIYAGADGVTNRWFLAALRGDADAPEVAPAGYVQALFDDYAEDFEPHLLSTLRYRGHLAVAEAAAAQRPHARWRSVLDLGCGTGLVGAVLRAQADAIAGVDLSQTMVERARRRGVYDQVEQADVVAHLQATPARPDLVVAADVFIYIGALEAVFAGVRRVLEPGGCFVFSVEEGQGDGFTLRPSLRYAHGEGYLRRLAAAHGFAVHSLARLPLREEQRVPVAGMVLALG
jgi:predicted TPR repeat methyltransferase